MKAEIKYFHSPDIVDLEKFMPKNPAEFCFLLQVMVGEKGQEGEESFDVIVCTPKWLLKNNAKENIVYGLHHLIVFEYNFSRISTALKQIVETPVFNNWDEVVERIGRIGKWEFEDYHNRL